MNPSLPRGTRDFNPKTMAKRNFILSTIVHHFKLYGFVQIETPAIENLSTLTGKYGEEGDQLLFKILNSRIHESTDKATLQSEFEKSLEKARNSELLTERALRYDLTVPFARFVSMHRNELCFPFRRYQIQPVWRADKPQKGRYREFWQCDADIIGSKSLINEIDLVHLMKDIYSALNIPARIKINHRKILAGIAELTGEKDKFQLLTEALDAFDKTGKDAVLDNLKNKGWQLAGLEKLETLLESFSTGKDKLNFLQNWMRDSETGMQGMNELQFIFSEIRDTTGVIVEPDITLARGLNYYTGAIFEVKADAGTFKPSITGGGRYDDLSGIFDFPGMSGVGISFGIDRIYDVMEELDLFPKQAENSGTQILIAHLGEPEMLHGIALLQKFRTAGIRSEIYPDQGKIKKHFDYANKKEIPWVCVVGSEEMQSGIYTLKNMGSGSQEKHTLEGMIEKVVNS